MILWLVIFVVALFVLIRSADYFIDASETISIQFNIPSFIVGATLVSIGTSLPELVASSFAVLEGAPEIVVGNVVGSNISNILLIFGVALPVMKRININFSDLKVDYMFLFGTSVVLVIFLWDYKISTIEVVFLLAGMISYVFYLVKHHKIANEDIEKYDGEKVGWKVYTQFVLSAVAIFISAKYTVEAIIELARIFEIGAEIIALTVVSLGTSIPELAVSISAARKGLTDIVIGNILGSNIFNTLAVMSIPAFFGKLVIPVDINYYSLPIMVLATVLFVIIAIRKTGGTTSGIILLGLYVLFIVGIFEKWNLKDLIDKI
ncbi:MAG: calcium/sodium antiporter [Chitinophagales bacterium]|nr:calcium/sodium antiporter [Chitinophagales bacterium]